MRCLAAGAADFWVRPLRSNEVRVLWSRLFGQQKPAAPAAKDDSASGSGNSTDAAAT